MPSSKNDNQASFGSKRPRNDVLQKDGDWICTTCGNLNFSFRITCNKNSCHAPKPSGISAPKPFAAETLKPFASSIPTLKPTGLPTSKPLIAPVRALATEIMRPYNGTVVTLPPPPLPMYGMPINFGSIPSSIPYGSYVTMTPRIFGPRTSIQPGSSIPPRSFGAIPFIPSGSFGGKFKIIYIKIHKFNICNIYKYIKQIIAESGIFVDPRSDINSYGYDFQGPFVWDARLTTKNSESHKDFKFNKDSESHKRRIAGPDDLSEGDWICPRCENVNFAFRSKCNMKNCRVPRPTPMPLPVFPEGSWSCNKCGNMNYPYRNTCNMKGCGVERPDN
ncbi:hypothetical protein RYX36_023199 [Vicia faba]